MTKISGWVFMIVGAAVSLFSRYVQKRGGEGMAIFFWAGIFMIGIGIFKLAVGFILKENKKDEAKEKKGFFSNLRLNKDLDNIDSKQIEREKQSLNKSSSVVSCSTCGTKHYSNSNFCHMCGTKLR